MNELIQRLEADLQDQPLRLWDGIRHAIEVVKDDSVSSLNEHQRIATILATFYRAPLTISALQPILDLAVELNPSLKENK